MKNTSRRIIVGLFSCLIITFFIGKLSDKLDSPTTESETRTEQTGTKSPSELDKQLIKKKRKIIRTKLTNYLDSVTKDGTASVSFYNLGDTGKKATSQRKRPDVYEEGSLEVESNAHAVQTAANTYKLFIAAFLMKQKLNDNFTWDNTNTNGFYSMIVNSENTYAEGQLNKYGMEAVNSFIKTQGWYSPVFIYGETAMTTSYSLELLLRDLAKCTGVFTNRSDSNRILKLIEKQVYRDGIPKGVRKVDQEATVQDKVGFLGDANNDAALVTLSNGQQYILVIMTHGHGQSGFSGFPKIAKIAKKVQEIVYNTKDVNG